MSPLSSSQGTIRFGDFDVDPHSGELRKDGIRIKLQVQPFQVLQIFLEHPGEVVTREELQKRIWPADTFVDFDQGLNNAVKKLRDALADDAEKPRFIETLPKRGYRFMAAVRNMDPRDELTSHKPVSASPHYDSIVVLPFENSGRDPELEYLSDGIAEAIINSLSRLGKLRVVPRATAFQHKGKIVDAAKTGRELRARVVLRGQVVQQGDRLIIRAELIDTAQESPLWGEKDERAPADTSAVQDEIVRD